MSTMNPEKKPDDTNADFDSAFAEASKDDDQQAAPDPDADADADADPDTDTGDTGDTGSGEEDEDAGGDEAAKGGEDPDDDAGGDDDHPPAGDGAAGAGGKEEKAGEGGSPNKSGSEEQLTGDQLLARMAELLGKGSAEQHQQHQQQQKKPDTGGRTDDEGTGSGNDAENAPPLYSEEEQQILEAYRNDWPDIARAEALSRRAEYQQLLNFVFAQVKQVLDPISETVEVMSSQSHLAQLQGQIPDYDDVRDKVIKWVEEQPAYLRAAYEHVITEGTAEEVADLVERYRKENGIEPPTKQENTSSGEQRQQSQDTELPAATKKAAAGLAPVRSKRSTPSGAADPADFDAAFAAFAAKI